MAAERYRRERGLDPATAAGTDDPALVGLFLILNGYVAGGSKRDSEADLPPEPPPAA